jgi:hypothetical protein
MLFSKLKNFLRMIFGGAPAEPTKVGIALTSVWTVAGYGFLYYIFVIFNRQYTAFIKSQGVGLKFYSEGMAMLLDVAFDASYLFVVAPVLACAWVLKGGIKTDESSKRSIKKLYKIKCVTVWLCLFVAVWFIIVFANVSPLTTPIMI